LLNTEAIGDRLDAVEYLHDNPVQRKEIKTLLSEIFDIERLSNKISLGSANARDMVSLAASLRNVEKLKGVLAGTLPGKLKAIRSGLDDFNDVVSAIEGTLEDEPPVSIRDGGIIRGGCD